MNAIAQNAYRHAGRVSKTPQETEAALLARFSAAMQSARDFSTLAAAVSDNLRLWNALADDLVSPGNALPDALKGQLVWLAEFTRLHSGRVLQGKADAAALIDINNAVMRGLNGKAA